MTTSIVDVDNTWKQIFDIPVFGTYSIFSEELTENLCAGSIDYHEYKESSEGDLITSNRINTGVLISDNTLPTTYYYTHCPENIYGIRKSQSGFFDVTLVSGTNTTVRFSLNYPCTGSKGDKGDVGMKGDRGITGEKGDKGNCCKCKDFTGITTTSIDPTSKIYTKNSSSIKGLMDNPENFNFNIIGINNTDGANNRTKTYSGIQQLADNNFMSVSPMNPQLLFKMYISANDIPLCVKQIDMNIWVTLSVTALIKGRIWNYTTSKWEEILSKKLTAGNSNDPTSYTKLVGSVLVENIEDYLDSNNYTYFHLYTESAAELNLDYFKVCYNSARDGSLISDINNLCILNNSLTITEPGKWCFKVDDVTGDLLLCGICTNGNYKVINRYQLINGVLNLLVIADVSGSISSSTNRQKVRDATLLIINTLAGMNVKLAMMRFSGPSDNDNDGSLSDATIFSDTSGDYYRDLSISTEVTAATNEVSTGLANGVFGGYTNWEAAFKRARQDLLIQPNVIVFITDGNPTVAIGKPVDSNENNKDYYADLAAIQADLMKQNNTRIIGVLIGSNITVNTLTQAQSSDNQGTSFTPSGKFIVSNSTNNPNGAQGPSGPDYWNTTFDNLASTIGSLSYDIC